MADTGDLADLAATVVIDIDDPDADDVRMLIETHLAFAHGVTPICHSYALPVAAFADPDIMLFSARRAGELLAVGALRRLDPQLAEIKSMHTAAPARQAGVGRLMLAHLVAAARNAGYQRVGLETGTDDEFAPARALYTSAGFTPCPPFGEYTDNPYSICMTLRLAN